MEHMKMQINTERNLDQVPFNATYEKVLETDQKYALIQINIKKFRFYNTKYGYKEGNKILSLVYNTLTSWLEEGEYVEHMYADNYAVLVTYDDIDTLLHKRLTKSIEMLECIKDPRIQHNLFLTYGVYEMKDKTVSFQEAWNAANLVRKETTAPTKRSSSLGLYQPTYQNAFLERMQLEVDTAEAYNNFEFISYYQPKVHSKTNEIIGAEALLRWYDANGNLVPLYKFLPILNQNSYIIRIDLAIFETTCRMLEERIKTGQPVVPISFNISKEYFYEDRLIEDYIHVFKKFDIPADLIEFEFKETISLNNTERLKKVVQGFKDNGFKCMLDDFGNGYSSFNVLLTNDLYAVKLDRQFFLKKLNDDNKLIIKTVINLIQSLHMKVIAEGVETKEYVDFLANCDCDAIQGYYFYKPMPMKEFCTLINQVN